MSARLDRAELLVEQRRYELAEREIGQALAEDPNNALAHILMARCLLEQHRLTEATEFATRGIGLEPDSAHAHYVASVVWQERNRFDKALAAAQQAVELVPESSDCHVRVAAVLFALKRWRECCDATQQALSLNPDNIDALNLQATAARNLGQKDNAAAGLQTALELDPEDSDTHANLGWNHLERGERDQALVHFREALRLEPDNEWARVGIVAAIKSKNRLYRWILNYFVWMQRFGSSRQAMMIIGAALVYIFVFKTAVRHPEWGWFLWPPIIAYVGFVLCTWFAQPLSNLALRLHPFGRLALSDQEKRDANRVGVALSFSLLIAVLWLITGSPIVELALLTSLPLGVCAAMLSLQSGQRQRRILAIYGAAVLALFLAVWAMYGVFEMTFDSNPQLSGLAGSWFLTLNGLLTWSMAGAVILANVVGMHTWKE